MHHALEIQEIFLIILDYCAQPDHAVLARTCRQFKEPALDALWEELDNLSPLARCLPEASRLLSYGSQSYSFNRPLTQTEWNILQSYTYRIRSIFDFNVGLDEKAVDILSKPPTAGPIFPNLSVLFCAYTKETMHLLHLPLPSLDFLRVEFSKPHSLQNSLQSFPRFSRDIRDLRIDLHQVDVASSKVPPNYMSRWQNLQSVVCPQLALDVESIVHLAYTSTLTRLDFKLGAVLPASDTLFFTNLDHLTLRSESLHSISQFLFQTRLPAIAIFYAFLYACPSIQDFSYFLASVHQASGIDCTIERMSLIRTLNSRDLEVPTVHLDDLRPCTSFRNLRCIDLDIGWTVGLRDAGLLTLASAWPRLEQLSVNTYWGWRTRDGITPDGLLQLLRTSRSLRYIAFAIDTRGYTEYPGLPEDLVSYLARSLHIDVLDSTIEAESVPAITAFFTDIATYANLTFRAREERWYDVYRRAKAAADGRRRARTEHV